MKLNVRLSFLPIIVLFATFAIGSILQAKACQNDPFQDLNVIPAAAQQEELKQDDEKAKKPEEEEEEGEVTDTKSVANTAEKFPDNYVRFHMWDGSIVAGELQVESISVKTEFGVLQVPIDRIQKLYPGLDSIPELNAKILSLVESLDDKDFEIREKSHRELASMGMQIRNEIDKFEDGGSAERKKRLAAIKQEINQTLDEFDEDESPVDRSLIRGDSVKTPEFEIVGKILQENFTIKSKFGELSVDLSDIKMAERSFDEKKENIRKNVVVGAEKFFQRQPVSTRIRVNKGDKISIKADGVVQWTNWSSSSTPEGLANQGQYEGIQSGTLCARIGSSGKIIKVGAKSDWTVTQGGVLYLAIAMQDSYLAQNGYRWTGEYNAKVQVTPGGAE